jgi:hypothetical protein
MIMSGLIWKRSPWDHWVHGFRELGEFTSEAICEHSALTSRLSEPEDGDRRCLACLLLHGGDLVDRIGDRDRYAQ